MKSIKLKIVTPEGSVMNADVAQVSLPTMQGEITVLPNHIPLISQLSSGDIVATIEGELVPMAVVGGVVHITPEQVTVLADFAEHVSTLTEEEVAKARARAEELKTQKDKVSKEDFEHFEAELERSLTRVKIADKWRQKKYKNIK